jgi:hypothetical protein
LASWTDYALRFCLTTDHRALLRISDSLAFGALARHVYAVVDVRRFAWLIQVKNSLKIGSKNAGVTRFRRRAS